MKYLPENFLCEECGKDFRIHDVFKKHLKIHKGIENLCDQCEHKSTKTQYINTHKKVKHEVSKHCCDQCRAQFNKKQSLIAHKKSVHGKCELCDKQLVDHHQLNKHTESIHGESIMVYYCYLDILDNQVILEEINKNVTEAENLDDMEVQKVINLKITTVKNEITKNVTDVKEKLHRLAKLCGECDQCEYKSTKTQYINTHKKVKHEALKHCCDQYCYLDILDNQVVLEDKNVTEVENLDDMEVHKVINLKITTVKNEITKNVTDVEEKLDRKEARWRLKRKKDKTQNHGASGQFNLITKRLHNYKMAAKLAATENWRENTKIIRTDEKMNKCLLLNIHWTMGCLKQRTKIQITWEESKHENIVKIRNKNGKHSTCQNVDRKYTKFRDKKNLVPRIQTAKLHGHTDNLQTGVKLCLPSYDLSVASVECGISN